jgi:hypothetical protein
MPVTTIALFFRPGGTPPIDPQGKPEQKWVCGNQYTQQVIT